MKTNPLNFLQELGALVYLAPAFYVTFLSRRRDSGGNFRALVTPLERVRKEVLQDNFGSIMFIPLIPAFFILASREFSWGFFSLFMIFASLIINVAQFEFNSGFFDVNNLFLNSTAGILGMIVW